jgi:diguanylate cyclase
MNFNPSMIEIPTPMALAILVLFAYVFSILRHRDANRLSSMQRDLAQARVAICEMEEVVSAVHDSTAEHCARLRKLKSQIAKLSARNEDVAWHELCSEVDGILGPTLKLIGEIASAQECIRHHSTHLQRFSELQVDPLTGVGNRRALEGVLAAQFGSWNRYGAPFSLAVVDVDRFKDLNDQRGHLHGDEALRNLAGLLTSAVRAVDLVTRYGGDEFVVIMPHTDLAGAAVLAERLREKIAKSMPFTVSIGVASAGAGDTAESLFEQADAALYRAKSDGRNRTNCHHDQAVKPAATEGASPALVNLCAVSPEQANADVLTVN